MGRGSVSAKVRARVVGQPPFSPWPLLLSCGPLLAVVWHQTAWPAWVRIRVLESEKTVSVIAYVRSITSI